MIVYLARDGAEIGEHPREVLEQLARDGELLPTDLCWFEGMEDWLLLEDFLGAAVWKTRRRSVRVPQATAPAPLLPTRARPTERRPRPALSPRLARIEPSDPPSKPESPWVFLSALLCAALIWMIAIAIKLTRPSNTEPPPVQLLSVPAPPDKEPVETP